MSGGRPTWTLALIALLGSACAPFGDDHDCPGLMNCEYVDMWEVGASDTDMVETVFVLSHAARPDTLQVTVNEVAVPVGGADGYTYEDAPHTVTLHGIWVPEAGALLKATYQIAAVP